MKLLLLTEKKTKDETKNKTSKKEIVKASGKKIGVRFCL